MPISKTQRWLDLIAFLVRHRLPVSVDEVMNAVPAYRGKWNSGKTADVAAVRRMFERDKDELRAAGIPLETVEYTMEHGAETVLGYRLASRDFYLPYLRLVGQEAVAADGGGAPAGSAAGRAAGSARPAAGADEVEVTAEEAATAIEALRRVAAIPDSPFAAEARSALRKLAFDLDVDALGPSPVVYAEPDVSASRSIYRESARRDEVDATVPGTPAHRELRLDPRGRAGVGDRLRVLTDALRRHARVRFRYHGIHRGEPTDRHVAPYGLLYQHGHWYLVGHDATRDAIRVFRVGRMEDPGSAPGTTPEFRIPADFRLADYAAREPWELGDDAPIPAVVRVDFPLSLWADRNGKGERVETLTGGAELRRFQVRQADPFLRWLQQFGGDARVVDPPALCDAQRRMARETLAVYGPEERDA